MNCRLSAYMPLLVIVLCLLTFNLSQTVNALQLQNSGRFQRLDIQQGLSQSTVTAIAQTADGAIWLGTLNGLNRYDGFSNKIFRPDNTQRFALSDNYITSLLATEDTLWIGTLNGLSRYKLNSGTIENVSFTSTAANKDIVILSLFRDTEQRLWLGTEQGLALFDVATRKIIYLTSESTPTLTITAIAQDKEDLLLGSAQGLFRYNIASQQLQKDTGFPLQMASVLTLYTDPRGNIWAGLEQQGLYQLQADTAQWQKIEIENDEHSLPVREIRAISADPAYTQLWVGSQMGLHRLQKQNGKWQHHAMYRHQPFNLSSIGSGKVASVLYDKDGSIWAGTWNSGVSRLHDSNNLFTSITASSPLMASLRNPAVINMHSEPDILWLGGADGLFALPEDLEQSQASQMSSGERTYYSSTSGNDYNWFGHSSGISRISKKDKTIAELSLPDPLPDGPVRRLWFDNGRLWVVIDQFGMVLIDADNWQLLHIERLSRSVTFIHPYSEALMLVGSYAGLHWFDRHTGRLIQQQELGTSTANLVDELPAAPMDYRQHGQQHWLATNGQGLYRLLADDELSTIKFKRISPAVNQVSPDLKSLEIDTSGNVWFSSANGISVYIPELDEFRHFAFRHGTLTRDYINAASTVLTNQTIAFGGMDGFTLFEPAKVLQHRIEIARPPYIKSVLTQPERGGEAIALSQAQLNQVMQQNKLTLSPRALRSISLEFSGYEYIDAAYTEFQYRLDPIDTDWFNRTADERTLMFERLQPGDYSLRLRARLPGSDWSTETTLAIQVLPHWWETTLARVLFTLMLGSLLLLIHFYRLQRLQKQQQKLGLLVKERTEALENEKNRAELALEQLESTLGELVRTEKLAALGQLVAGVAHEVNTPLGVALTASSIISDESQQLQHAVSEQRISKAQLNEYLSKLAQASRLLDTNLQRAAQLITNFKQVSVDRTADNRRKVNLNHYLNELMESLSLLWKNRNIVLTIECPESLTIDSYPGSIGQVITNLTQNAILHGFKQKPSGSIRIRCKKNETGIELRFADNGQGIEESVLEQIFDPFFTTSRNQGGTGLGLHIVHNLVTQKLCGAIRVKSTPGKGTEFIINLPLSVTDTANGTAGY